MGCGQSKIGIIYPRKSKSKSGNKRSGVDPDSDEEADEADPGLGNAGDSEDADSGSKVRHMVTSAPGPLLAQTEISSSQMDFFRMLDEKIENGPDYDSANEEEIAVERARLCALLRDWETASTNSSLNRSAPSTPAHRKLPSKPQQGPLAPSYYHPHVNGELFLQQQNLQQQQLQQQYFHHHPEDGGSRSSDTLIPVCQTAWYHFQEHCIVETNGSGSCRSLAMKTIENH